MRSLTQVMQSAINKLRKSRCGSAMGAGGNSQNSVVKIRERSASKILKNEGSCEQLVLKM